MEFNNDLAELVDFFYYDNETLELVNSLSSITVKDLENVEQLCDPEEITFLDTSKVENMKDIFRDNDTFNLPLLWNTKNVTTMEAMFHEARSFNQPLYWHTDNVTTMMEMFQQAYSFNQPLEFNTKNVTNMAWMFDHTSSFNQPLEFNTEKVMDMGSMFSNTYSFNQPLKFNTENVRDMSLMFDNAISFNQPLEFNTENVTTMVGMFSKAVSFNQPLEFNMEHADDRFMYEYAISCERKNIHETYFRGQIQIEFGHTVLSQNDYWYQGDAPREYEDSDDEDDDWDLEEALSTRRHIKEREIEDNEPIVFPKKTKKFADDDEPIIFNYADDDEPIIFNYPDDDEPIIITDGWTFTGRRYRWKKRKDGTIKKTLLSTW